MSAKKDLNKIVVSFVTRFLYQIIIILTVFFLTPIMVKKLGDYKYGIWVLSTIIINYCGYTDIGITSAIERNLAVAIGNQNKEEFNKIFLNGFFLNLLTSLAIIILTCCIVLVMSLIHFKDYKLITALLAIMGLNLALTFPFKSFSAVLTANIRLELSSFILSFQAVLNAIMTILLLNHGYELIALALSTLFVTLLANIFYIFFAYKISDQICFDFSLINKITIKNLLKYSGKTFLTQIADMMRFKLDEVVTGTFISINLVTSYSIANRLNQAANTFCLSFLGALSPFFSQNLANKSNDEQIKLFFMASKVVIVLSSFVLFNCLYLGKPFINIWMGVNYLNAYAPLVILATAYFFAFIQSAGVNYMYSTNTHQYFAYIAIFEGIINFILSVSYVIFFKLGIIGVALGTLTAMLISKIFIQPVVVSRLLKIKVIQYYSFFGIKLSIGIILYLLTVLLIKNIHITGYHHLFLISFIFMFTGLIHSFFILDKNEKLFIKDNLLMKFFNKVQAE